MAGVRVFSSSIVLLQTALLRGHLLGQGVGRRVPRAQLLVRVLAQKDALVEVAVVQDVLVVVFVHVLQVQFEIGRVHEPDEMGRRPALQLLLLHHAFDGRFPPVLFYARRVHENAVVLRAQRFDDAAGGVRVAVRADWKSAGSSEKRGFSRSAQLSATRGIGEAEVGAGQQQVVRVYQVVRYGRVLDLTCTNRVQQKEKISLDVTVSFFALLPGLGFEG